MKYDKKWITHFNLNKDISEYENVLNDILPHYNKCRICNDVIYYYDSSFRISRKKGIYPIGKSFLTSKKIYNKNYYLTICESCLMKEFPEYENLNKTRIFNRICDITNYAFNIPYNISNEWKKDNYSISLKNLIKKHGKKVGEKKWKEYCKKQSISNTFHYKKNKYGWDEKKFKEYNKSRSITLKNLILKHGEKDGLDKWNDYIEKQRYTCSLEYFNEKYGSELGKEKFDKFSNNRSMFWGHSKISEKLFETIIRKLNKDWTYYYSNNEYNLKSYLLDFYIEEIDFCLEFNGDIWHANPLIFNENDNPNPFNKELKSKDIWDRDNKRISEIKKYVKHVIIVWENELKDKGMYEISNKIVNKINKYEIS